MAQPYSYSDELDEASDLEAALALEEFLTELKECAHCGMLYQEIDSRGKWQCAFHPGQLINVQTDSASFITGCCQLNKYSRHQPTYVWSCCGQPAESSQRNYRMPLRFGCTPHDHSIEDRPYTFDDSIVTTEPASITNNRKAWLSIDPQGETYAVLRLDLKQANYRIEYGTYNKTAEATITLQEGYITKGPTHSTPAAVSTPENSGNDEEEQWFTQDIRPTFDRRIIKEEPSFVVSSKFPTANAYLLLQQGENS